MNSAATTAAECVPEVRVRAQELMTGQGAGHDWDHVQRVTVMAERLHNQVGGKLGVIQLAALLHDVGDAKFHDGVERSAEIARDMLRELGLNSQDLQHVIHIVDNLSFRKRQHAEPLSLEGQVVQDADRLDALGAIGIIRTIEYGAVKGQPFHVSDDQQGSVKTGLQHFDDKLFHLVDLMNTDAARQVAKQREAFMREFIQQFHSEWI